MYRKNTNCCTFNYYKPLSAISRLKSSVMRKSPFLLLVTVMLFAACNNNKPKDATIVSNDGKEKVTIDMTQSQNAMANMQKQIEELQKLPPLTLDQLKALMPAELMGAKQSNYSGTSMTGASYAHADYKINDTTDASLGIYDCAGAGGAGIYSAQYMTMMNFQQEDENSYTKTIDFMGQRAIERCEKNRSQCTLTYFAGGRFLVTMEGNNVGADALKQAAQELNIK